MNKKIIKRLAGAAIYNRGLEIVEQNKVESLEYREEDEQIFIRAVVQGSGRKKYKVKLAYDAYYEDLSESYCECPAFRNYEGICKHCAAVLLEYESKTNVQQTMFDYMDQLLYRSDMRRLSDYIDMDEDMPHSKKHVRETTPAVKELLKRQTIKAAMPLLQEKIHGKVELEPFFECSADNITVEFRIGAGKKYVLKDIFEFARNMESNAEYSYGKNLKFFHELGAFTPVSQKLAEFILSWTDKNKAYRSQYSYNFYYYNSLFPRLRKMSIGRADFEELLEILKEKPVTINFYGSGERKWQQTEDKPVRKMVITGKHEGIEVELESLPGYDCARHVISFKDGLIYKEKKDDMMPIQDFLACIAKLPEKRFYIDQSDVPAFCRELLPLLEKYYECEKKDFRETDYGVEPASFEIYLDAPQKDFVTCKVYAVYGEKRFEVYDKRKENEGRDVVKEMQVGNIAASYCNAFDEKEHAMVISGDEDKIYELLTFGILRLQELGDVYVSDALKRIHVVHSGRVEVGVSLSGDLLELTMESAELSKDELIEILSKYDRKKKYFRLKNGSFVQMEDEGLQTLLEVKHSLNLTDTQLRRGTITAPKYRALYLDSELREKQNLSAVKNKEFKELIRNMKTIEDNDFEPPASLEPVLRPYQRNGFLWLKTLKHNGFGGILADDMGLGKTLQVISFLLTEYLEAEAEDNRRVLIVTPASLVFNWKNEFERFAPVLPVKMVIGTVPERKVIIQNAQSRDILITSYELLKRDLEEYALTSFFCQVIDEAQYIKNHNTQAARAVKEIDAVCRFALTGTPIENRLSELWSIFDYLMPGFLYGYQRFRTEIEVPVVQNQDEKAMTKLQKMVRPFILRRLKKDVLTDLPDKLEECMYAHMEGEQWKLYCAHVQRLKMMLDDQTDEEFKTAKIQILSELTKLRQLCCDPSLIYEKYESPSAKTAMCIDLIKNAVEGGHKILLFSQFTSMLENLQKNLTEEGISYYVLTGTTPKEKRLKLVEDFNKDETSVFCISLRAGGTGLNLTAADIVIHYDPWWNLAVQNQATDRAHRIGQKHVVNVYKLIMKDTIEENIIKLQERKRELAEQVLSGENLGSGSFTREELLELLTM
ncbi:MAG: DEAD/DEAH box helicase [Lachnospiraceae bacterium]|nr:DEAD/DEAH box helicase [Lachnospiraceae bacterium]